MDKKIVENIIKGTSATTLGTISSMGFHFISIFFLTRHLPVADFGTYVLIIAISGMLNLLSCLGLEISIVKYISEGSELRSKVLYPALILKTIATIIVTILFLGFYNLYPTGVEARVWNYNFFLLIIFIIGSYRDFFYRVLQGLNLFKYYTSVQISSALTRVILIILFIYIYKLTLLNLLYIEVATALMATALQYIFIPFRELLIQRSEHSLYKQILKFSSPLFANNLITFAYERIGIFTIGIFLTASSVAIYDVSTKLPGAFLSVVTSFTIVFFPNISTLFSISDKLNAEKLINNSLQIITFGLTFVILIVFLWRLEITVLFFSNKYIEAALALGIMMIAMLFRAQSNILGLSIVSAGYSKIPMKVNFFSMIVGITSNLILVWQFGYMGAVFSAINLNLVSFIQYNYYINKLQLVRLQYSYLKPFFVLLLISIPLYVFNLNIYIINILGVILFLIVQQKTIIRFKELFLSVRMKATNA